MSLNALQAELVRTFRIARSYWLEYILDFVLYTLGFLLLITVFNAAAEDYGPQGYLSSLLGYIMWKVCASVLVEIAEIASNEARTGTLEQMFLTGVRPGLIFLNRSFGAIVNYGVRGVLLGLALATLLGILQPIPTEAIFAFILSLGGAIGMGFALAGLVLLYKRLDGLLNLIWQLLVFFTGALAPINQPVLSFVSKLLPLTWGIDSLRAIFLDGANTVALWQKGLLSGLILNTGFYLALGIGLFIWGQHRARVLGVLSHY